MGRELTLSISIVLVSLASFAHVSRLTRSCSKRYGELIDPSKAGTAPQWQVDQQAAGQMSAAEAIALMETQAKQGVVQAAVPGIEVPSVIALEQTATIPSGSQMAGTKIARDANAAVAAVEAEAKEAEKAVENTADEAVDAAKKV